METECVFCKIVEGRAPCHKLWEDDSHIAFLSIFPNTRGFTVVATKDHAPSYIFSLEDSRLHGLMTAAKKVALLLDASFKDVGRTGCMMEGFGVDHAHVKLFPMHGTAGDWQVIKSSVHKYFERYEGYLSSHDHVRADDRELHELAQVIRKADADPQ